MQKYPIAIAFLVAVTAVCLGSFTGSAAVPAQGLLAPPAAAVKIGDGSLDASRLQPYDNAFVASLFYPDGRVVVPGIWTDQLRQRDIKGHTVLVRTQGLTYFNGKAKSSVNVFDPVTFAPISDTQHNPDGSIEEWIFEGDHVEGRITPGAAGTAEKIIKYETPTPYFDLNCCMRSIIGALLSYSTLKPGYVITVPANDGKDAPVNVPFTAIRKDKVRAGARGLVDAWLIESPMLNGYVHFWINDKPPYLVRMFLSANSANPFAASFEMIGAEGFVASQLLESENAFPSGNHQ